MQISNSYLLNKVIESLIVGVIVYFVFTSFKNKLNYTTMAVLLVAVFITLLTIDVVLGRIAFDSPLLLQTGGNYEPLPIGIFRAPCGRIVSVDKNCGLGLGLKRCGSGKPGSFYDVNEKDVIETMDDPVAKLYYSQNRLPEKMNLEGLYKRQYNLKQKDCNRSECQPSIPVDNCLNMSQLGVENSLFGQNGGSSDCVATCSGRKGENIVVRNVKSEPWTIGTQNGNVGAPYCMDVPESNCKENSDPILGSNLEPDCVVGCMPCDLNEVPSDFAKPLNDRIVYGNFYKECEKVVSKKVTHSPIACKPQSIVQPHHVNEHPAYFSSTRTWTIKNK